ncbi:MAG TPA: hypothetical protein VND64_36755 [Pirellulales bacterium]|nr:hypothetical protein [Pirellulales bacterium]
MQSTSSDATEGDEAPAADVSQIPEPSSTTVGKSSIWAKAKETLAEVSTQASSASGTLAAKVAALGTTGAARTAEFGKQTIGAASDATRAAIETSKQAYVGSKLESAVNYIDEEMDDRGAKKAIKDTTGAVVGKLDQMTGKRLVELLETKLQSQDAYNDVLATRLAEALERIARLEVRVCELHNESGVRHEH